MRLGSLAPFGVSLTAIDGSTRAADAETLQALVDHHGLVLVRGLPALDRDGLLELARRFDRGKARLLAWDFGPVMEMKRDPAPRNYLFSDEAVPFHWDGAFHREPSYLVFQCLEAPRPDDGGETLFTHAGLLWDRATEPERRLWRGASLTYETEKLAHYGGSITVPMAQAHPRSGRPTLRYAEEVETALNPVTLRVNGVADPQALVRSMRERLYDPSACYVHAWQDGDLLIADNHALLHARRSFRKDGPRWLRRVQIL